MRKSLILTFLSLIGIFLVIVSEIFIPEVRELFRGSLLFLLPFAIFFLLAIVLIFLTLKEKIEGRLKKFLLLTGVSGAGLFVSVLLHNLIYGLFIYWFGQDFWKNIGIGDEILFFFLAIIVCPIAFLVGVIGSMVLFIKQKDKSQP